MAQKISVRTEPLLLFFVNYFTVPLVHQEAFIRLFRFDDMNGDFAKSNFVCGNYQFALKLWLKILKAATWSFFLYFWIFLKLNLYFLVALLFLLVFHNFKRYSWFLLYFLFWLITVLFVLIFDFLYNLELFVFLFL